MTLRPGIQARVMRQLGVDRSLVSKIANGTYHPTTRKGLLTVARVTQALAREARLLAVDDSHVSVYQHEKAKRLAALPIQPASVDPLRRRRPVRDEPGHVVTCDPAFHGGLVE